MPEPDCSWTQYPLRRGEPCQRAPRLEAGSTAGNRLDAGAYRCADVAARNRQNGRVRLPCCGRLSPGDAGRQRGAARLCSRGAVQPDTCAREQTSAARIPYAPCDPRGFPQASLPEQPQYCVHLPWESRMPALMRCAIVLAALVCGVSSAAAEFRIRGDNGGQIGLYLQKFAQVRDSGERVVIDGPCYSACTLALAVIPRDRICVTANAVLGFHAAWTTDRYGHTSQHAGGT